MNSRTISAVGSCTLACNGVPRHWRDRLGDALRALAERLDGRRSLALRIEAQPALAQADANDVIEQGLRHMAHSLSAHTRFEIEEQLLQRVVPDLFDASSPRAP